MVIGITGGSGSGKTTVVNMLLNNTNTYVIEADEVFYDLLKKDSFNKKIKELLPEEMREKLDYLTIENFVQQSEETYRKYHEIIRKKIEDNIIKNIRNHENDFKIIVDTFLLERNRIKEECDYIISVITPEWQRIQRLMNRDKIEIVDAVNRVNIQKPLDFYVENSDYTLSNSMDGFEDLEENIVRTLEMLLMDDELKNNKKINQDLSE